MTTDISERGLERLICTTLTGSPCEPDSAEASSEHPTSSGLGWLCGNRRDYDREHCLDLAQLSAFLAATQPEVAGALGLSEDSPARRSFLARLQGEVARRGTVHVLRNGVKHGPHQIDLFYGTPSPENERARTLYAHNRFTVTRQ
ncbi:MAG: type I restriction endonuclease subunit R, partial [Dehalococcoidia bacterium]|nr:type I restriction endonuclease subunit R [Dehalococcoidia bacterium]